MRWGGPLQKSDLGKTRKITKFLLVPRCVRDGGWKWLEKATWEEEVREIVGGLNGPVFVGIYPELAWVPMRWVEE